MRKVKWAIWGIVALIVAGFLDYTLPQHDVVRITEAYNRVTTVSWANKYFYASPDTGTAEGKDSRDIRFINAAYADGKVMVYRNEDTGWIWPPYFKYDSSNLQAVATNLKSSDNAPKWVMVTHYGWRWAMLSIYPNAVRITEVSGPDVTYFPWLNVIILVLLALLVFMIRRMWLQFWERMVDPAVAEVQEAGDRTRGWFSRLFGRKS
jgi:hypothetical protein